MLLEHMLRVDALLSVLVDDTRMTPDLMSETFVTDE